MPFPDLTTQYDFEKANASGDRPQFYGGGSFYGGKYTVVMDWFDQQEYLRRRTPSVGSTTGMGRPEQWCGTGHYSVAANGYSIQFSIQNYALILSGNRNIRLKVIGNETLDFVIIERYERNKPLYYIISAKD